MPRNGNEVTCWDGRGGGGKGGGVFNFILSEVSKSNIEKVIFATVN